MIQHLDLFSGIGGFAYAGRLAYRDLWRTVAFCEIDRKARLVLKKHFPEVEIHHNIKNLDGYDIVQHFGKIDIITGGFPCQPFSVAGQRKGAADDRALWPQMRRIIAEVKPAFVLGENVTGIISMELDGTLSDLENLGYTCRTFVIPACAKNAPHIRSRVWIVGQHTQDAERIRSGEREVYEKSWHQTQLWDTGPADAQRSDCRPDNSHPDGITRSDEERQLSLQSEQRRHLPEIQNGISECRSSSDAYSIRPQEQGKPQQEAIGQADNAESLHQRLSTYADRERKLQQERNFGKSGGRFSDSNKEHTSSPEGTEFQIGRNTWQRSAGFANRAWDEHWITVATRLCGISHGLSRKLDEHNRAARIRMLGNAIVPQVAAEILSAMELDK